MKKALILLVVILTFSVTTYAEEGVETSSESRAHTGGVLGGSFALLSGTAGFGVTMGYLTEIGHNLSIGIESGVYGWSASATSLSASANVLLIPILPTVRYFIPIQGDSSLNPFVGLSAGIGIVNGSLTVGSSSASSTNVNFTALLHLGVKFTKDSGFFIDPKFGITDGSFVFLPTVGMYF